jgi:pimeloyl-ACP methyl ester carboxylesterase
MLATLRTAAVFGVEACTVQVEVDVSFGMPAFTMVGLPDASVRESRDRVRSAIRNSGFDFPAHRITVNLAPADVRKAGAAFDLPIALGILAAQGVVARRRIFDLVILGELSLDGAIQQARGVLPTAVAARREGATGVLLPRSNASEAGIVSGLDVLAVSSLAEAVGALNDPGSIAAAPPPPPSLPSGDCADLADVRGQLLARRALEITSAGGHIQSDYMEVSRNPEQEFAGRTLPHEEWRRGFQLVKNVAIDVHVLARNRQFDLIGVIQAHPDMLGVGIDDHGGFTRLSEDAFLKYFANGVAREKAQVLYAVQQPTAASLFSDRTTVAAWRSKPNFYAVSKNDGTIAPEFERFLAERMKATTIELDAGHLSMVSHPREIADLILAAAGRRK